VIETPVISLDLTATALAAGGAKVPANLLDGRNLVPLVTQGDVRRREPSTGGPARGGRCGTATGRLCVTAPGRRRARGSCSIFAADVAEVSDLAATHPERLAELVARWEKWSAEQAAPLW
jgi:arylsulfatase A-like enzyme